MRGNRDVINCRPDELFFRTHADAVAKNWREPRDIHTVARFAAKRTNNDFDTDTVVRLGTAATLCHRGTSGSSGP